MGNILDYLYVLAVQFCDEYDLTPLFGFLIALTVNTLQMLKHGKFKLAEALLCGVFAAIASGSVVFIGGYLGIHLPAGCYPIIAGAIGWFGTDAVVDFLKARFNWGAPK